MFRLGSAVALSIALLGAAPAGAAVVWRGDFETGTLEGWPSPPARGVTVVGEPVKEGYHAVELQLATERLTLARPLAVREGMERFYGFFVFVPRALGAVPHELARIDNPGSGQPLLAIEAAGETVSVVSPDPAFGSRPHGSARLTPGKWHHVIVRVLWSRSPRRGVVDVWFGTDNKIVDGPRLRTLTDAAPVLVVGGVRRGGGDPARVLYDEVTEATTRADLVPPAIPRAPGQFHADVEFARPGGEPLRLDAFVPKGAGPFPTVIIVHGGGFVRGDKQSYVRPLFDVLADAGFAWFSIDYRLAPRFKHPAALDDVEAAIAWVHRNARRYRVDRQRVALLGESAGGFLVSAVGTRYKRGGKLAAVVPFYTYHEFKLPPPGPDGTIPLPRRGVLIDVFGVTDTTPATTERLRAAAPLRQVHREMPPFLLYHSKDDPQVPFAQSVAMCDAIKAVGGQCDLFVAEALGHGLSKWKETPAEHARLVEWLRRAMNVPAP